MHLFNVTQYLDRTVRDKPERLAVLDGGRTITLGGLRSRCLSLGREIRRALGGRRNQVVALYLPKSLEAVAADIAVLYGGQAYMNLDVRHPKPLIAGIIDKIKPALIITQAALSRNLAGLTPPVLILEEMEAAPNLSAEEEEILLAARDEIIDTDPLCVINTSGSTGVPKGVVLNHRSFIDFTECVIERGLVRDGEIAASLSPLIFDIYSFELCMLMAKGNALLLIPEAFSAFPVRIIELMAESRATFIFWVPTIMVNIANMDLLSRIRLPDLRMIWFAGEVFPTPKFNYWRRALPEAVFANFYGPIEITLDCVYYVANRPLADDEPIPIGRPFRNTDILILAEGDRPAAPGEEGELCVRGSSLAMGYYNDPEKTAAAFTPNPLNRSYPELIYRTGDMVAVNNYGELVFKGRRDGMIKHLGYRIELTGIEHTALAALDEVKNCCAVYNQEAKRIVLFYESPEPLNEKEMRRVLGTVLPRYMIPTVLIHLKDLPRNTNGKIDRLRLRDSLATD